MLRNVRHLIDGLIFQKVIHNVNQFTHQADNGLALRLAFLQFLFVIVKKIGVSRLLGTLCYDKLTDGQLPEQFMKHPVPLLAFIPSVFASCAMPDWRNPGEPGQFLSTCESLNSPDLGYKTSRCHLVYARHAV